MFIPLEDDLLRSNEGRNHIYVSTFILHSNMNVAYLSHFSLSESGRNIFLCHVDEIREDICGEHKKNDQAENIHHTSKGHILKAKSVEPSLDMELNMA